MPKNLLIEESFINFYQNIDNYSLSQKELDACASFYKICYNDQAFTQKQAKYLEYILKNHAGELFTDDIVLVYKHPFRTIDTEKRVWIESSENKLEFCLKFPFDLKKTFEENLTDGNTNSLYSYWDHESKCRKLDFYSANYMKLINFVEKNNFIKEESFVEFSNIFDHVIAQQEDITPYAYIENGSVKLKSESEDVQNYFEKNKRNHLHSDLFLAKIMGFALNFPSDRQNKFEKICSSKSQFFHIDNFKDFFEIIRELPIKISVLLDRADKDNSWLKNFVEYAKIYCSNKKIVVCYRESGKENPEFNHWIKANDLGGKVEGGDIFVFQHKPAKWIFKNPDSIQLIVTNMINPPSNSLLQDYISAFPCVFYLTETTPTKWRNINFVSV